MIAYRILGHRLVHEVQTVIQVFYPNQKYNEMEEIQQEGITLESAYYPERVEARLYKDGILFSEKMVAFSNQPETEKEKKRRVKFLLYEVLQAFTGYRPPWGFLTGIRPAKVVNELFAAGETEEAIVKNLTEGYAVNESKARLSLQVAKAEHVILCHGKKEDIHLYIGIPFCPSRCYYCSFPSYPLAQYANQLDRYCDALEKELLYLREVLGTRQVTTIYVGGGTPTSLDEPRLERLLKRISKLFIQKGLKEFTVEAGRPDTVTPGKMQLLKQYHVDRISINPQTMNQKTLDVVGRKHTVEDVIRAMEEARDAGHLHINMDLIVGLPGEGPQEMEQTMEKIAALHPEGLTVHTLAVKRASQLKEELEHYQEPAQRVVEEMLTIAYDGAAFMQMHPYYMYRQKNMVGCMENVGFCLPQKECIYNVEIMEERHTILAAGAGASTKVVEEDTNHIFRIFNVKNVQDYMDRIDEMIERKKILKEVLKSKR